MSDLSRVITGMLVNPHSNYDEYGRRIAPPDISREEANALTLANRQADPNKFRGAVFDAIMGMGADPGQASLLAAPTSFMPFLGDIQDFEDVGIAASQGDYLGAALGAGLAMAPLIPARAVMKGKKGIRAYHGSPHDFDEFRMDRIGTGEGAQAYGHGLYFAESEDVAKVYRDELSQLNIGSAQRQLDKYGGDVDAAIEAANAEIDRLMSLPDAGGDPKYRDGLVKMQERKLGELNKLKQTGSFGQGRMYEVNINADPDDFLDWDAPLSEQGDIVTGLKDKLAREAKEAKFRMFADPTGPNTDAAFAAQELYNQMDVWGGADGGMSAVGPELADRLRKEGIPGIKYYDGASRSAGEGTRNYVVFDDSLVSIVKKYGIGMAIGLGLITQQQGEEMQAQGLI